MFEGIFSTGCCIYRKENSWREVGRRWARKNGEIEEGGVDLPDISVRCWSVREHTYIITFRNVTHKHLPLARWIQYPIFTSDNSQETILPRGTKPAYTSTTAARSRRPTTTDSRQRSGKAGMYRMIMLSVHSSDSAAPISQVKHLHTRVTFSPHCSTLSLSYGIRPCRRRSCIEQRETAEVPNNSRNALFRSAESKFETNALALALVAKEGREPLFRLCGKRKVQPVQRLLAILPWRFLAAQIRAKKNAVTWGWCPAVDYC